MTAKCSMCHGSGIVTSQTICDCKKLLESPPRDWKPVVGDKVLVEAVVVNNHVDGRMSIMFREAHSCYPTSSGMVMSIPKPFIHPMPGKNG